MFESKYKSEAIDELFQAIIMLDTVEDCYRFFEDLTTVPEIRSLAQRLQVAKMLTEKETYTAISEKTGASTATISRVKSSLFYGADGYKMILDKLHK
ncbi:MAG: YerC/YecD family TrpR-related protein [Oscillospiraceae bacterium]|nr:YerC/YecD family TrpR-related protein [Oscillospiraceae bacterium]